MVGELSDANAKIRHCLRQLSDGQLWWREKDEMNSIANLILHLCGNVRQWVVSGVGGEADTRDRPQEFAERDGLTAAELLERLERVVVEAGETIKRASPEELLRRRMVQGFDVTGMQAIIDSVAHFRGHTQEIVHLTRIQLGDDYQYDFVPGPGQNGGAA